MPTSSTRFASSSSAVTTAPSWPGRLTRWRRITSSSAALGGSAVALAADKVVDKGRRIAAHLLEAAEDDVEFADGRYAVSGTDRTVDLIEVAKAAYQPRLLAPEIEPGPAPTANVTGRPLDAVAERITVFVVTWSAMAGKSVVWSALAIVIVPLVEPS